MMKEIDIVDLIKSKRYLHLALRHLLKPKLRKELKALSEQVDIDERHPSVKEYEEE